MCEICSKVNHNDTYISHFEHISHIVSVFPLVFEPATAHWVQPLKQLERDAFQEKQLLHDHYN